MKRIVIGLALALGLAACGADGLPRAEGAQTGVTIGGDAYFGIVTGL